MRRNPLIHAAFYALLLASWPAHAAEDELDEPAGELPEDADLDGDDAGLLDGDGGATGASSKSKTKDDKAAKAKAKDDDMSKPGPRWDSFSEHKGLSGVAEEITSGVRVEDIIEPPSDYRYAAFGKSDPFVPPMVTEEAQPEPEPAGALEIPIVSPLQRYPVYQLKIVGIWRLTSGERKAMIMTPPDQIGTGAGVIVKTGDPIGDHGGKILGIGEDYMTIREFTLAADGTRQFEDHQMWMGKRSIEDLAGRIRFAPGSKDVDVYVDGTKAPPIKTANDYTKAAQAAASASAGMPGTTGFNGIPPQGAGNDPWTPPAAKPQKTPHYDQNGVLVDLNNAAAANAATIDSDPPHPEYDVPPQQGKPAKKWSAREGRFVERNYDPVQPIDPRPERVVKAEENAALGIEHPKKITNDEMQNYVPANGTGPGGNTAAGNAAAGNAAGGGAGGAKAKDAAGSSYFGEQSKYPSPRFIGTKPRFPTNAYPGPVDNVPDVSKTAAAKERLGVGGAQTQSGAPAANADSNEEGGPAPGAAPAAAPANAAPANAVPAAAPVNAAAAPANAAAAPVNAAAAPMNAASGSTNAAPANAAPANAAPANAAPANGIEIPSESEIAANIAPPPEDAAGDDAAAAEAAAAENGAAGNEQGEAATSENGAPPIQGQEEAAGDEGGGEDGGDGGDAF